MLYMKGSLRDSEREKTRGEGEKTMTQQAATWKATADTVLDVRPDLEQGGEPFVRIMEVASAIQPGGTLVIIAPFEPVPLYDVLEERAFTYEAEKVTDGEWVVRFLRHA